MKLTELRIENFRSFKEETVRFDDYTCLVGANGSGKSAVLMALNVFFRNNDSTVTDVVNLTREDFHHEKVEEPIKITLTFEELPDSDDTSISKDAKDLLALYARHNKLVLFAQAVWDPVTQRAPVKHYGSRFVMEELAPYFDAKEKKAKVAELKEIYTGLREKCPDLPNVTTGQAMHDALREYEDARPDKCVMQDSKCECCGFTGGLYVLAGLMQWVYVPAVKDATTEQEEGTKTALGQLLERTVRRKIEFEGALDDLKKEAEEKYEAILEKEKDALKGLGLSIEESLKEWTNPRAAFELEWYGDSEKAVQVRGPIAKARVGEDAFMGEIARLGHGMQRGFLIAILKELAMGDEGAGPKLLLGFEEPELYQHPPQAQHMAGVLERLAEEGKDSQIIVTTHSPYFVSSKGFKDIRMFRKRGGKNPYSAVKQTDYEKVKDRLTAAFGKEAQSPTSLMATVGQIMQTSQKELFFSPVVVLVEGQEDVAYIATHLNLTGEWKTFRANECHFVVADCKNNIPRLLAIAQEFEIPTFVVCDSDIESSLRKLKKAEGLPAEDKKRAQKTTTCKEAMKKHGEVNNAVARLCGVEIEDPFKCETVQSDRIVMWKDTIGSEVGKSFEEGEWQDAQNTVVEDYGYQGVTTKRKNGMIIAATLQELYKKEKQSPILIDLCGRISQYAQKSKAART